MKCKAVFAITLCASTIGAHYFFPWLIVNGTLSKQWKYIRDVAEFPGYAQPGSPAGKSVPHIDLYSTNFTCGRLAFDSAGKTETADVIAGEEIAFKQSVGQLDGEESYAIINHPGPAQAYLAKAPNGDLESFSGVDGEWFKIASLVTKTTPEGDDWAVPMRSYDDTLVNITIPATTPPGKYLLRFEQYWPRKEFMQTQFFINCAHINVIGPGGGNLDGYPFAKFPGTYDYMDPGIYAGKEIVTYPKDLSKYVPPGPPVWEG